MFIRQKLIKKICRLKDWFQGLDLMDCLVAVMVFVACNALGLGVYVLLNPCRYRVEVLDDQLKIIQTYRNVKCLDHGCNSFATDQGERFSFPNSNIRAELEKGDK